MERYVNLLGAKGDQTMNQIERFNAASAFGLVHCSWEICVDFGLR